MAVYTFLYNSTYSPPAPVIEVEIGTEHSAETHLLSALVDSGADATLLPKDLLKRLKAQPVDVRNLRTVTGARVTVTLYRSTCGLGRNSCPIFGRSGSSQPKVLFWAVMYSTN